MSLTSLGVSTRDEAVYRFLISQPTATPDELAVGAGLTVAEVAAGLEALVRCGLVAPDPATPAGVQVRQPGLALPALAVRRAEELARGLHDIAGAQAEAAALDDLFTRRGRPEPVSARDDAGETVGSSDVEVLRGRAAVQSVLEGLAQSSTRSMDSITTVVRHVDSMREAMLTRSVHRGLRVRWLVRPHVLRESDERTLLENSIRSGVEMRVTTAQDLYRLVIVDSEIAFIPRDVDDLAAGALLVRQPVLLAALQASFDRLWEAAAPLHVRAGRLVDPPLLGLDVQDRQLLDALAAHGTDEAAAKALSVSERQLRRRIAKAVTALEARNRFHAGVLAERHDLLASETTASGHERSAGSGRPDSPTSS